MRDRIGPGEALRGKKPIDEQRYGRQGDKGKIQRRAHLHEKRHVMREQRDGEGEQEAPEPESGVVRGSEIMKKVKIRSEPLCS